MKCDIELLNIEFALEFVAFDEALIDNEILPEGSIVRNTRNFSFLLHDRVVSTKREASNLAVRGTDGLVKAIIASTQQEYADNGFKLTVATPTNTIAWEVILHRAPSGFRSDPRYLHFPMVS